MENTFYEMSYTVLEKLQMTVGIYFPGLIKNLFILQSVRLMIKSSGARECKED